MGALFQQCWIGDDYQFTVPWWPLRDGDTEIGSNTGRFAGGDSDSICH